MEKGGEKIIETFR